MKIPYEPFINEQVQRIAKDVGIQLNTTVLEEDLEMFAKRIVRDVVLEISDQLTAKQLFTIIGIIETRYGKLGADPRPTDILQEPT